MEGFALPHLIRLPHPSQYSTLPGSTRCILHSPAFTSLDFFVHSLIRKLLAP